MRRRGGRRRIDAFTLPSCGPCNAPVGLTVDGMTLNGPDTEESCGDLSSMTTDVASGEVTFRALGGISLGEGFRVLNGATFVADSNPYLVVP